VEIAPQTTRVAHRSGVCDATVGRPAPRCWKHITGTFNRQWTCALYLGWIAIAGETTMTRYLLLGLAVLMASVVTAAADDPRIPTQYHGERMTTICIPAIGFCRRMAGE